MKSRYVVVVALVAVIVATTFQARTPPRHSAAEIAEKRAHFARVFEELDTAPTDHLTAAQRERRRTVLRHLHEYAERGVFPLNTEQPGYAIPYFIDEHGTRCALAYAIDQTAGRDIVKDLAKRDNHAFVTHVQDDPKLMAWIRSSGLTLDDAAFIQFPGFVDNPPGESEDEAEEEEPAAEEPPPAPEEDEVEVPVSPPPTATPGGETQTSTRRRRGGMDLGNWQLFWRVNRDAYVSLRRRYHDSAVTSGTLWAPAKRSRRPSADAVREKLMPLFLRLAQDRDHARVGGNALMAALLAAPSPEAANPVVEEARAFLRNPDNRSREYLLLGVGHTRNQDAASMLLAIAGDRREGREALGRRSPIPERMRAFAALGLAHTNDGKVVGPLRELLERLDGRAEDLRASAITSMGILLPLADEQERYASVQLLLKELKRERWPRRALTAIPTALLRSGDAEARKVLLRRVERFRGERDVRSSVALALGTFGTELDTDVVNALTAAARRDPDLQTRRYAAIAVGELALRDTRKEVPAKMRQTLRRFYLGTFDGHFKQPGAMEWHYLSAGMFARRFPADAEKVLKRLERLAVKGRKGDERAAAVLSLGLSGHAAARQPLRKLFESEKSPRLRGSAAEALGMLGDRASREELLKLATTSNSNDLRYQAALALGYLADASVVPQLVDALEKARSEPTRAALTRVLGQIGDERAIAGLVKIAEDKNRQRAVRERAVSALGLIAREADASWTLPVRRGANIPMATPSLRQMLFIF
ncbi:MAG: HEAT repeat domain-containing protein [Planctomycetota bacterium]|jgi:hypothetical protein